MSIINLYIFHTDVMIQMNFTKEEIRTSLLNNRYDEVMATYLLLDEKRANLSVCSQIFFLIVHFEVIKSVCWLSGIMFHKTSKMCCDY